MFILTHCFVLAYDDLVVPLRKACPEALNATNRTGVTPLDLLSWMKQSEVNTTIIRGYAKICTPARICVPCRNKTFAYFVPKS